MDLSCRGSGGAGAEAAEGSRERGERSAIAGKSSTAMAAAV